MYAAVKENAQLLSSSFIASSPESVGEFWLGEITEAVI
jgi:hypothetical protein